MILQGSHYTENNGFLQRKGSAKKL